MAKATIADGIDRVDTLKLAHTARFAREDIIVSNGSVLVAVNDALVDVNNAYAYAGKIIAPKVNGTAFAPLDKCYWDASAGNMTKETSGNTLAGICVEAAGGGRYAARHVPPAQLIGLKRAQPTIPKEGKGP
jgi:predicted RecA/RadA family phage recombinase